MKKIVPVKNSTNGYGDLFLRTFSQFPDNKTQLKSGILSNHLILDSHLGQKLLGNNID